MAALQLCTYTLLFYYFFFSNGNVGPWKCSLIRATKCYTPLCWQVATRQELMTLGPAVFLPCCDLGQGAELPPKSKLCSVVPGCSLSAFAMAGISWCSGSSFLKHLLRLRGAGQYEAALFECVHSHQFLYFKSLGLAS